MSAATPAVLYAAKSTEDTKGSLPTQLDDCRAMAEREGWEVVGEFKDEGFSAFHGNRGPGLERAKARATEAASERGECILVVQHTDRLARGAGDEPGAAQSFTEVWHELKRLNVSPRSVQNDDATTDPLYAAFAAKLAHDESKRKSAAVKDGKRRRAGDRRRSNGRLAFGYRLMPSTGGEGNDRVPDPDEAPVVREMFARLDSGESVAQITRWLNRRGVKTKDGNDFGRSRVRDILRNPYYGGRIRHDGEVLDGAHEGLLPWAEFERISGKLGRSSSSGRGGRPPNSIRLLSGGVMRCAHCGHGIWHREPPKGQGGRTYCCGATRHATGTCDEAAPFDAQVVEEAVLDHLGSLFVDLGSWIERLNGQRAEERDALARQVAAINDRRTDLSQVEGRVRDDYRRQLADGQDAAARIAAEEVERIETERGDLDAERDRLLARLDEWEGDDASDEVLDWWKGFSDAIRTGVVDAESVKDANRALRDRFAAIFVRSPRGGTPRLDFVLAERAPGAPVVASQLWANTEADRRAAEVEADRTGSSPLLDFIGPEELGVSDKQPGGSHSCGSSP